MLALIGSPIGSLLPLVLLHLAAAINEWLLGILFVEFWNIQVHRVGLDGVHLVRLNTPWRLGVSSRHVLGRVAKLVGRLLCHVGGLSRAKIDGVVAFLASCRVLLTLNYLSVAHWLSIIITCTFIKVHLCVMELKIWKLSCISWSLVLLISWSNIIRIIGGGYLRGHHLWWVARCYDDGLMLSIASGCAASALAHWVLVVIIWGVINALVSPVSSGNWWFIVLRTVLIWTVSIS